MSMKTEKINQFKEALEKEKKALEVELAGIGIKNPSNGDWEATPDTSGGPEADENDLADRAEEFEERSSLLNTLEAKLTEVNDALDKISRGIYGICEISGEQIEETRLEANPSARTCIKHKETVI